MHSERPRIPIEVDQSAGAQDFLSIDCSWDEGKRAYVYSVEVRAPDATPMHSIVSDKIRDRTGLAVLIASRLAKDPHFGFGQDQRPYWWIGNRWVAVDKWLMSLDYSMHVLVRTALVSKENSLTAEAMAAWRANSDYSQDGLNLTAFGSCKGVPLEDGVLDMTPSSWVSNDGPTDPEPLHPHDPKNLNLLAFPVMSEAAVIYMLLHEKLDDTLLGKFFKSTLTDSQIEVFQKWLGYHLVINQVPNPEKMLYLWGSGANGKSQLIWLIRGLVGQNACAELRLSDLRASANVETLLGKVAMLGAEANTSTELERLKGLISREPQNVNPKYRDPYTIDPECLITQASNYPPAFEERSDAMSRRVISLHLTNTFQGSEEKVEDIAAKIVNEEFPVLFAFALHGAQKVLDEGRFRVPDDIDQASKKTVAKGNPFERFVAEQIEFGAYEIAIPELYTFYAHWCRNGGGEAFPAAQHVLLEELMRIAIKEGKGFKKGRSLNYRLSMWVDKTGKEVEVIPGMSPRPEVIQGLRINNKNGQIGGQELPPNSRAAKFVAA